jgi:hypothetical protein
MPDPAGLFFCPVDSHVPAMRPILSALPCILLAACAPQDSGSAPAGVNPTETVPAAPTLASSPAPASTLAPVESLAGEWRVAGIDGAELNEPSGLALSGSVDELWWRPRCAGMARSYRIDGLAIRFGPPAGTPPPSSDTPPPPVCAIGLPPRLADVMRALDAANTVGRTPGNGIEISGGGHSVLLFSQ